MKTRPMFLQLIAALSITALFLPVRAYAQLNADSATSTIFISTYDLWWGDSIYGYPSFSSDATSSLVSNETSLLTAGSDPTQSPDGIYATPSLYAAVKTPSGTPVTFSATGKSPGGYNSNDDAVITYHAKLLANLGVSAVLTDISNHIDQIFANPISYSTIADNLPPSGVVDNTNPMILNSFVEMLNVLDSLDPAVTPNASGPAIYVIPLVGGQLAATTIQSGHTTSAFQNALAFFWAAEQAHPKRFVTYSGHPLIVFWHDPNDVVTGQPSQMSLTDTQAGQVTPGFAWRHMTGYVDDQTDLWAGSSAAHAQFFHSPYTQAMDNLWTWVDRIYNYSSDSFSSYTLVPGSYDATYTNINDSGTAEFCAINPTSSANPATPFLAVRAGEQINHFMSVAHLLNPKFALVGQFNQFINDWSGYTLSGRWEIEPTVEMDLTASPPAVMYDGSGNPIAQPDIYNYVQGAINNFRIPTSRFYDIAIRGQCAENSDSQNTLIAGFTFSGGGAGTQTGQRVTLKGMGPSLQALTGYTCAPSLAWTLTGTDSVTGSSFTATNNDHGIIAAGYYNGNAAGSPSGFGSALNPRTYQNSSSYINYLNYGETMQPGEPAITADLDPGAYSLIVNDPTYASSTLPGRMTHVRLVVGDRISPNRLTNFSVRGYVSSGNNVLILGFWVDGTKTVTIQALANSLSAYFPSGYLKTPAVYLYSGFTSPTLVQTWTNDSMIESGITYTFSAGYYSVILLNQYPNSPSTPDGTGLLEITEQ